jgi:hypothetical protein
MGWRTEVRFPLGAGKCFFIFGTASNTQPRIQWAPGFFPGLKRSGREADFSPPSSAEAKKAWNHTSTLPIRLHGVLLNYALVYGVILI